MGSKEGKANPTAREKSMKSQRNVVLVYECYRKPNGAIGMRKHFENA